MCTPLSQLAGLILFIVWSSLALASEQIPVKWGHSIYAPSYGLDDSRLVTHQSDFAALYKGWSHPLQFLTYPKRSHSGTLATFRNCDDVRTFSRNAGEIRWDTDLDSFRFWIQASNCRLWATIGELRASKESYLPDLIAPEESNEAASKVNAVRFTNELVRKLFQDKSVSGNPLLRDFKLQAGWKIYCGNSTKCRYEIPGEEFETILINYVAQGDYDGDGINDFFVSIFAPSKLSGYIGLIVTRKTKDAVLQVIHEY